MHTPTLYDLPSLKTCHAAWENNLKRGADPKNGEVSMTARLDSDERPMKLFVIGAWAPGDHAAPPSLREHEYAILGLLQHEMICLKIMVIVDTQTTTGYIRECVSYPPDLVNPWPFLAPTKTIETPTADPLSPEDEKLLAALSMHLEDMAEQHPIHGDQKKARTRVIGVLCGAFGWTGPMRRGGCKRMLFAWQVCQFTRKELLAKQISGVGNAGLDLIDELLVTNGLSYGMNLDRFRDRLPKRPTPG